MVNEKGLEKSSFIYKEYKKAGKFFDKITTPKIQNSIKQEKINQNYTYYMAISALIKSALLFLCCAGNARKCL